MTRTPPLVEVEWLDIEQCAEWQDDAKVCASQPAHCRSVGYLRKDTEQVIVLSHTVASGQGDRTTIPRGCVVRVRRLKRSGVYSKAKPQ